MKVEKPGVSTIGWEAPDRIVAQEIDMVGDDGEIAGTVVLPQPARRAGEHDGAGPGCREEADRMSGRERVEPLVDVEPSDEDPHACGAAFPPVDATVHGAAAVIVAEPVSPALSLHVPTVSGPSGDDATVTVLVSSFPARQGPPWPVVASSARTMYQRVAPYARPTESAKEVPITQRAIRFTGPGTNVLVAPR